MAMSCATAYPEQIAWPSIAGGKRCVSAAQPFDRTLKRIRLRMQRTQRIGSVGLCVLPQMSYSAWHYASIQAHCLSLRATSRRSRVRAELEPLWRSKQAKQLLDVRRIPSCEPQSGHLRCYRPA
ncbi:hypothetical protein P171DRAFT_12118 [Karstenula rhodostoma CBS 690.94]|uniref:Uncharacterized protein n=1 Tax=Karstenula rhodostoma CBS 690.94 TaxID=1392251 RepID=A0A9P4PWL0_9PLEO|nr:hypothetical protein P171DRAFT_12118 [Karstenula rhodostoma CBS 690.94]